MKLSLDSPVVRAVTRFGDLVLLSILWFIGSIPVFTLGVSCSAVYAAIHRTFGRNGEGIAALEYLRAYRSNFRQSTLSFLPLGALELLLLGECFVTDFLREQGAAMGALRPLFLVLAYLVGLWIVYTAAYAARFSDPAKKTVRQSGILALANPSKSIVLLVMMGLCLFAIQLFPHLILILPGAYLWLAHKLLERIFADHLYDTSEE